MRHRIKDVRLSRDTNHRKALITNLVRALILEGEVTTTPAKAKVLKRQIDKVISRAKTDSIANRRLLHRVFGKRDVVNTLFERVAPLFTDRVSGFTTSATVGVRRGDSSQLIKVALLQKPEVTGTLKNQNKVEKKVATKKAEVKAKATTSPEKKAAPKKAAPKKAAAKKTAKK